MLKRVIVVGLIITVLLTTIIAPVFAQGDDVVRAVFFYSPTCPHCRMVTEEILPILQKEYGSKLIIAKFDTSTPVGSALWQATVTLYQPAVVGVPTMVIGDKIMVGSREIPDNFPVYLDHYLQLGGADWPALPGIMNAVEDMDFTETRSVTLIDRFTRDLAGNIISLVVLVALVITLFSTVKHRPWQATFARKFKPWGIYVVILIGLTAAAYLSYVETTHTPAICGPIGDCNTVQQSKYAILFGFLPVAVLGLVGYLGILFTIIYEKYIRGPYCEYAPAVRFLLSFFAVAFSTYLTFLEPFVIGATCAWCLTSAVCSLLLALLSADAGWIGIKKLTRDLSRPS